MAKAFWEARTRRSPWLNAAYAALMDGAWHPYPEIYAIMYDQIPPGRAKQTTIARRENVGRRKGHMMKNNPTDEELIQSGKNQLVIQTLHTAQHGGFVEIRKKGPNRADWLIRLRLEDPGKYANVGEKRRGFLVADPDVRKAQRRKAKDTRRQTRRIYTDQLSDEEALLNTLVPQRTAVFTRPWLWPSNPAPVFCLDKTKQFVVGWCTFTEEGGKEKWVIEQIWPTNETITYWDVFTMVEDDNWRVRLKKDQ